MSKCKCNGGCPHTNSVLMALAVAPIHEQAQFQAARHSEEMRALAARRAAPFTVAASAPSEPPDPPSLSAAVGGREVPMAPTYIFGRPQSRPPVTATGVPEPPSLIDAIRNGRQR